MCRSKKAKTTNQNEKQIRNKLKKNRKKTDNVQMRYFGHTYSVFLSASLLLACKPTSESSCLSTSSETLKLAPTEKVAQGGYIQFDDKACNATFDVEKITSDTIKLRAYSARHCRSENALDNSKTQVHLYFSSTPQRSAGYVKNIPVTEDFTTRSKNLLKDFQKSSLPKELEGFFLAALKVPTHSEFDSQRGGFGAAGSVQVQPENIVCFNEKIPRFDDSISLTDLCWSALDVGIYDLEISKTSVSENVFKFLSQQLADKQKKTAAYLQQDPKITPLIRDQKGDLTRIQSNLRFQNYAPLAYLLSFDHCKVASPAEGASALICRNQNKLIELAGKYLTEIDTDGSSINIFDRLARETDFAAPGIPLRELRAGRRLAMPQASATFATLQNKAELYSVDMFSTFKLSQRTSLDNMLKRIEQSSNSPDKTLISQDFVVSTNVKIAADGQSSPPVFAQFSISEIALGNQSLEIARDISTLEAIKKQIHGVTQYGTLRIGVRNRNQRVSFDATDSGSLITLFGMVPLMVLNTVDDKPVSGGASILALPEAQPETDSSADGSVAAPSGPSAPVTGRKGKTTVSAACR
ncbi:MAG: hypothetical protein RLZZ488_304 [Pseudomonadota bacterium]|jgi:hypothetical protein